MGPINETQENATIRAVGPLPSTRSRTWKSLQIPAHYAKAELAERGAIARFKDGNDET